MMEKTYDCKECNKTFAKYYDLRRHNKLHTGEHPFMCEICGLGFTDNNRLIIHVGREHTGRKPFECSVCDKAFGRSSDLNRHMKVHDKDRLLVDNQVLDQTLECSISEKNASIPLNIESRNSLFQNSTLSLETDNYQTPGSHFLVSRDPPLNSDLEESCGLSQQEVLGTSSEDNQGFLDQALLSLAEHSDKDQVDSGDLKIQFPLEVHYLDDKIFDLAEFNKIVPNNSVGKPTSVVVQNKRYQMAESAEEKPKLLLYTGDRPFLGRPFECKYCEKSFTKSSDLKRHLMIHTGDRPFVCSLCGMGFIEKSKLVVHNRHHTGERPFECTECGKAFIKKSDMTNHMKTHSGERNFVCCECGKAFIKKSDLTRHTRLHTGERPYVCVVCGAAFTESGKLKKHMVVHTGEKNVQCESCGKRFAKNSDLRRHTRIHTGERPYVCSICSKSFTYSQMLKEHLRKEHNVITTPPNQKIQDTSTQFADVVDSINSSIVTPALAFLVNQNQKDQTQQQQIQQHQTQQQFTIQPPESSEPQPSSTSAFKDKLQPDNSNRNNDHTHMQKWNEQGSHTANYPTYSRVDSSMMNVPNVSGYNNLNIDIKEETVPSEEN